VKLSALLQESLATATRTGAAKPSDFAQIIVATTVQPKAIAFPTDAKLMQRAREKLVRLAKKHGVTLRQSYQRVGKRALIKHQRCAHAKLDQSARDQSGGQIGNRVNHQIGARREQRNPRRRQTCIALRKLQR